MRINEKRRSNLIKTGFRSVILQKEKSGVKSPTMPTPLFKVSGNYI